MGSDLLDLLRAWNKATLALLKCEAQFADNSDAFDLCEREREAVCEAREHYLDAVGEVLQLEMNAVLKTDRQAE